MNGMKCVNETFKGSFLKILHGGGILVLNIFFIRQQIFSVLRKFWYLYKAKCGENEFFGASVSFWCKR